MQNFRLIIHIVYLFYMVVACIIMYCQDYQEIKGLKTNYITMYYPGRKPVYLSLLVLRLVSFASS